MIETKVLRFLVEKLGGHKVDIVPAGGSAIVGFSITNRGTFAICDLLDVADIPDDGRPCSMDKFVADLFGACDDPYDRLGAINEWLHGDWPAAMAYLDDARVSELEKSSLLQRRAASEHFSARHYLVTGEHKNAVKSQKDSRALYDGARRHLLKVMEIK